MKKTDQYCQACYPSKVRSHREGYFFDFLDTGFEFFTPRRAIAQLPRFPAWFSITHWFYKFMLMIGIIKLNTEFNKKDHYPRSWVVIQEAIKRKIPIASVQILKRVSTYYRVYFGSKAYYFDAVPSRFLNFHLDDKAFTKAKLFKNGFPASEGRVFWSKRRGLKYGIKLGFPLAVKPGRGTHAYHVTAPINNQSELESAIILAKQYQPRFIIERYLIGNLYRVTVINFDRVFVARRDAPNVIGDGARTVRELIEIKNTDPQRGETGQKDTTLHKIALPARAPQSPSIANSLVCESRDSQTKEQVKEMTCLGVENYGVEATTTERALTRLGITLDYIPKKDEKIILHNKISIGSGGDIIEETPKLHPENREMFRRAARLFGTDLVGFDVVAKDLSLPYSQQDCGIIEANSIPMIDFHHNPAFGISQNAAVALWDGIIADKYVRYIYPVLLPERSLFTRLVWHIFDVFLPFIRDFSLRFRLVRMLSVRQRFLAGWLRPGVSPESAIAYLKENGFEVVRPEWIDHGEISGLRKLLDAKRQCHIRFFNDGEVRAHLEYAPEARPIAHILERNFHPARDIVYEYLGEFMDQDRQIKSKKKHRRILSKIRKIVDRKNIT